MPISWLNFELQQYSFTDSWRETAAAPARGIRGPFTYLYLTPLSHLGWPSRAVYLGGLGLIRTSP